MSKPWGYVTAIVPLLMGNYVSAKPQIHTAFRFLYVTSLCSCSCLGLAHIHEVRVSFLTTTRARVVLRCLIHNTESSSEPSVKTADL